MNYTLKIVRTEETPNYKALLEEWEENNKFGYRPNRDMERPQPTTATNVLTCVLTEEQFKALKLEAIKAFE